jgi:hypothetical protein
MEKYWYLKGFLKVIGHINSIERMKKKKELKGLISY